MAGAGLSILISQLQSAKKKYIFINNLNKNIKMFKFVKLSKLIEFYEKKAAEYLKNLDIKTIISSLNSDNISFPESQILPSLKLGTILTDIYALARSFRKFKQRWDRLI